MPEHEPLRYLLVPQLMLLQALHLPLDACCPVWHAAQLPLEAHCVQADAWPLLLQQRPPLQLLLVQSELDEQLSPSSAFGGDPWQHKPGP